MERQTSEADNNTLGKALLSKCVPNLEEPQDAAFCTHLFLTGSLRNRLETPAEGSVPHYWTAPKLQTQSNAAESSEIHMPHGVLVGCPILHYRNLKTRCASVCETGQD